MDIFNERFNEFSKTTIVEQNAKRKAWGEIVKISGQLRSALERKYTTGMMKKRIVKAGISESDYQKKVLPRVQKALLANVEHAMKITNPRSGGSHPYGYWPGRNLIQVADSEVSKLANATGSGRDYELKNIKYNLLEEFLHAIDYHLGITKGTGPVGKAQLKRMTQIATRTDTDDHDKYYCEDKRELYAALKRIQAAIVAEKLDTGEYMRQLCALRKEAESHRGGVGGWVQSIVDVRKLTREETIVQLGGFGCIDCDNPTNVAHELQRLAKAKKKPAQARTAMAEQKKK